MGELAKLKNIGLKTEVWLNDIGIYTLDDMEALGVVEVYKRLKQSRNDVSQVALYALQGAVMDLHWNAIPEDIRLQLIADATTALNEDGA